MSKVWAVSCVALLCACTHSPERVAPEPSSAGEPVAGYVEPTPYLPTHAMYQGVRQAKEEPYAGAVRLPDESLPWKLVSPVSSSLLIQYFPGCNQTGVAQLRETADAVVLRVVRHGPRSRLRCLTMRVETVPLAAPLGKRRLIHAASS